MTVHFLGGAGTVTGSKTLIESEGIRILVDCGLFQGIKPLRLLNRQHLSVDPETIDFVLLTHGHLDHCGWLPKLVADGYKGPIFMSQPTVEITKLILLDSAKIQEEEAERANKEKNSKHEVAEPLYTVEDAEKVFPLFRPITAEETFLSENISVQYFPSGHIIGACSLQLNLHGKILVFSGDVGRNTDDLMLAPQKPQKADYIFLESTYGNRLHPNIDVKEQLASIINTTVNRGGQVVIPSFAVERAQSLMYLLWQLQLENRIPKIPYVIDTPMGVKVLAVFSQYPQWHKLTVGDLQAMTKHFKLISSIEETYETIFKPESKVVIAASGMVTGGRVLAYLEHYIDQPENSVILVGYQAEGTRGRKLLEGTPEIKFFGKYHPVKAEIHLIESLSAHGDQKDLLNWLSDLEKAPEQIFIVHGENEPADELRVKINERYGFHCTVPLLGQVVEL